MIAGYSNISADLPGLDWLPGFTVFSVPFTAFAVGGIANAIYIVDGVNGLAVGTVIVILTAFGAMVGFLVVNWPLGKSFLGDGGACFARSALAWLAVLFLQRHAEVLAWAPMLACGHPIFKVLFSIMRRRRCRKFSPGDPDRLHLHSLVKRWLACALLANASGLARNSVTGAILWFAALVPAAIAVNHQS